VVLNDHGAAEPPHPPGLDHLAEMVDPVRFAAAGDPQGREWILGLPALVRSLCRLWELEIDVGTLRHGYNGIVIPVRRRSDQLALKIAWPANSVADEAHALKIWDGRGLVRLVEADLGQGALLLERLDAHRPLKELAPLHAAAVAGALLRRIAIPAPPGFRDVRTLLHGITESLQLWRDLSDPPIPVPTCWLDEAIRLSTYLEDHACTDLLIHADLHYDNILAGEREPWLAIDPRAIAGEPEQAISELVWTRIAPDEDGGNIVRIFQTLVEAAALDCERARTWVIVRSADYLLWGVQHGLTIDPGRCRRILETLL
jgi:streptomycin 6-kinase